MQRRNEKEFRIEKVVKKKGDKLFLKWKRYNNLFTRWIDKKDVIQMSEYFPEPKYLGLNLKIELDLPNYATKAELIMRHLLIHQILLEKNLFS